MKLTAPKFWYGIGLINLLLWPLSWVWRLVSWLRMRAIKPYISSKKIIIIGGCLVGGSGKTPVVRVLRAQYPQSVVLVKSYNLDGPTALVDPNNTALFDESLVHAMDGPTIICNQRVAGIKLAESLGFATILCDDGMQDPTIKGDYIHLVIDGHIGFGNGLVMPAGPNRTTPAQALARADAIVQLNGPAGRFEQPNKPYQFYTSHIAQKPIAEVNYLAFCGLAIPQKFYESALLAGFHIIDFVSFPDHYRYSGDELGEIITRAEAQQCQIITTEKDYVKIPHALRPHFTALTIKLG